ncbi:F5/8 type C domain-containing protein [Knoellia remsis]|uniref:F5/8 type C domain-containing protein n=1 Tax=Knoellia remsis TaxID=407159 RepID=A0A2T0V0Z2_9MICO|nr:family 16 glycosylhydrolase [Knoellia remsis]PRY63842.1 F5/8 type C domain-containing protein [Knoellia remsis]
MHNPQSPSRRGVIAGAVGAAGVAAATAASSSSAAAAPAALPGGARRSAGDGVVPHSATAASFLSQGYELTWRDEFDKPHLDPRNWTRGFRSKRSDYIHPGDNYCYAGSQVSLGDGFLRIIAENKEKTVNERTVPRATGGVSSRWHQTFTYGYFEARFRQNIRPAGWTFVPAFWLDAIGDSDNRDHDRSRFKNALPTGWGAEVDILESSGLRGWNWAVCNLDDDGSGAGWVDKWLNFNLETDVWHTVSCLRTPEGYTFYLDDIETGRVTAADRRIASTPMYLMLSAAGHMPPNGETGIYDVDYVRVYQHPEMDAPVNHWTGFDRGPWHLSASSTDGTRWSEKVNKVYSGHGWGDFWRSAAPQRGDEWFMIDLGVTQRVRQLRIVAPQAYPQRGGSLDTEGQWAEEFEIYSASAPPAWRNPDHPAWGNPLASGRGDVVSDVVFGRPVVGRYLMIRQTGQNPEKKWSIRDIYAFDKVAPLA